MKPKVQKIRVQSQAFNLLQKYGQLGAAPVAIEDISYREGMRFGKEALRGCEARLVRGRDGAGFARISDRIKEEGRIRFAISHQLGHFILHLKQSQTRACTAGDMVDYRR